jgi:hypothetical protein
MSSLGSTWAQVEINFPVRVTKRCFEDKLVDSETVAPPDGQIMHTQSN